MSDRLRRHFRTLVSALAVCLAARGLMAAQPSSVVTQNSQVSRIAGTIKSVAPTAIIVRSDSGPEVTAQLGTVTRILRVAPGEKDLTKATAIAVQDLQSGDRVLVRGQASADNQAISALAVIVMKQADVSAKREHDRQDWQKRGVGGLVDSVDPVNGTVSISTGTFGTTKKIEVHTSKDTVVRRYAPNSTKFDDAKPATIDQIKTGDQLRARGDRGADGSVLTADEIVSGSFRNIAGTISAVDRAANSITVKDAIAKSDVVVKLTPDSQMKKLPPELAQHIAMRFKHESGPGAAQPASASDSSSPATPVAHPHRENGAPQGDRNGGPPDIDRLLARLPNISFADLQKGDAVMIVSNAAQAESVTAVTLLAGVEPILTTAPNRNASAMMLSPWALGSGSTETESGP